MALVNGVLAVRETPESRRAGCEDGTCPAEPIKTAANNEEMGLSSLMAVENLGELKNMRISQGKSFILFTVLAVARYEEPTSRHGSILVLYTHLGEISLDGTAVTFQESIAHTFSRAGLVVDTSTNRRLLGVVEVVGMFNMINRAVANSPELDGAGPAMLPKLFRANVTSLDLCDQEESERYCMLPGSPGVTADWATYDISAAGVKRAIALESHQEIFSMRINGKNVGKSTTFKDQWPEQSLSVIQNESHKLTFQTFEGTNYYCVLQEDRNLAVVMESRRKLQDVSTVASAARRSGASDKGMKVCFLTSTLPLFNSFVTRDSNPQF
jgi:hypothetical protein